MRNDEREDSPEGNRRHRREDPPEERAEEHRAASPETTSSNDQATWNFLKDADDFDHDDETEELAPRSLLRSSSSSESTCVVSEAPRANVFERLKRNTPNNDNSHASKKQPRQEDCLRRIRSALHYRCYWHSIWVYETKTPWVSSIPAYFERRAFREWEEHGHTLQWYATGEVAAQLLIEAVSLRNLAQEIHINAAGKFLTSALTTACRHNHSSASQRSNKNKNDEGLDVDLSLR